MAKRLTVTEFLARYDVGETFTEEELKDIFWGNLKKNEDDCVKCIEDDYGENRRWSRMYYRYWLIGNRYFFMQMDEGLTEYQDNWYGYQPQEVTLKQEKKVITVIDNIWTPIEREEQANEGNN